MDLAATTFVVILDHNTSFIVLLLPSALMTVKSRGSIYAYCSLLSRSVPLCRSYSMLIKESPNCRLCSAHYLCNKFNFFVKFLSADDGCRWCKVSLFSSSLARESQAPQVTNDCQILKFAPV